MTDANFFEPDLAALGAEVSAFAPKIDKEFERELGARVAAGFPRDRRSFGSLNLPSTRKLVPAFGLATLLIVGVVAVGVGTRDQDRPLSASEPSNETIAPSAAMPADKGAAGVTGDEAPTASRKVERGVQLTLTTSTDDVQDVADGVVRETQAAGGYVADSSVSTSSDSGEADFTLRIPAKNLDKAIASLSKLANVGSLSQDSEDITSAYISASDRLADAQQERKALLKALAGASGAGEIASLKQRIAINRRDIAAAKSEVRQLNRRADLSTVEVQVSGGGENKGAAGPWSIDDATSDAVTILGAVAGGVIVGLAVAVPALLVAGIGWLLIGAYIRRRRNATLNSA